MSGNENGNFDPNTGRFTAPVSGRYSFGLSLGVKDTSGGVYYYEMALQRDGSTIHDMYISGTTSGNYNLDGRFFTAELDLNKGQYVNYYIWHGTWVSSGLQYGGSTQTYFEGKLIKAT